jgi:hypothetical protein
MKVAACGTWILFFMALQASVLAQQKPEDCVPGKEFWSTFLGECFPCPSYFANCDEKACNESCGKSCYKNIV